MPIENADWNPMLRRVNGLPDFGALRSYHLASAMEEVLKSWKKGFFEYKRSLKEGVEQPWLLSWERFANELERLQGVVDRIWGSIELLQFVADEPLQAREAQHQLAPELASISAGMARSRDLHQALLRLRDSDWLSEAQSRIVRWHLRDCEHLGASLGRREKWRLLQAQQELVRLSELLLGSLASAEERGAYLVTEADEVAGLPEPLLAEAAAAARAAGHDATPSAGPWLLMLVADSELLLRKAANRELRQAAYEASHDLRMLSDAADDRRSADEGDRDDDEELTGDVGSDGAALDLVGGREWIIERILRLRQQWAASLGFDSFADLVFSSRVASAADVGRLLGVLHNASLPVAAGELQELQAFAGEAEPGELMPWDVPFWRDRLRQARLDIAADDDALRPYFALENVLAALFGLMRRLLGVDVYRNDEEVPHWREGVAFFRVANASFGMPLGGFYFDRGLGREDSQERGGGFTAHLVLGRSSVLGSSGEDAAKAPTPQLPVACVVREGAPGEELLSLDEVASLFRAMGRVVQELLTQQEEGLAAGTKCLEYDAIGLTPAFLERWAFERRTLQAMAKHHATGEPLPGEALDAIIASRSFHQGLPTMEELAAAKLDLELHGVHGGKGPFEVAQRVRAGLLQPCLEGGAHGRKRQEEVAPLETWQQLFAVGPAIGGYIGLWTQVLAADAFDAFREAGLEDDAAVARLGRDFHRCILAPGGGRDPLEAFREFRGRPPRAAPLLHELGLRKRPSDSPPA